MKSFLILVLLLGLNFPLFGQSSDPIDHLARDTQKIIDLIVKDSVDSQIQIEADKVRLLHFIQSLDFFKLKCDHVTSPPLEKIERLNNGETFFITSNNPVLSKVGIDLIHLRTLRNRVMYAQGTLNGEEVYFKLVIDKDNKVTLTYFPVDPKHIPRAIIVSDPGKKSEEKSSVDKNKPLVAKNELKGNRVISKIVDPETGKVKYVFEGDDDDVKGSMNLTNQEETAILNLTGKFQEEGEGDLYSDLSLKDKNKKNEVYARAIIISEDGTGIDRFGYRYHGKNIQLGVEQKDQDISLNAKAKKTFGQITIQNQVNANEETENTKSQVTFESKGKKTKIQTGVATVDSEVTQITSGVEQKIGKAKLKGNLELTEAGEKISSGLETPLGDKTKATTGLIVQPNDDIIVKAQIVHQFSPEDTKLTLTAGTDIILKEEGGDSITPEITLSRNLDEEGQWQAKTIQSANILGGEVTRIKGRAELNHKNGHGSMGLYIEGSMYPSQEKIPELGAGIKYSHDLGGDGTDIKLFKVHKLYKIIEKDDQHIGYYLTWRYECNVKKKKLRIDKQRKPLFGSINLSSLFSYALPKDVPIPKEVFSPDSITLENFCK